MAETTDRPPHEIGPAPSMPAAPLPAGGAVDEAPKPYSSLSLLAIGGFLLGVGYSASMALAAVIALFNRTPLLLPMWTLAFPVCAAVVCWAARARIRNSEGALTGALLTAWGLRSSLAVGVLYAAYYTATYTAVTSQASVFAEDWLNRLKQGKVEEAFALTQPTRPSTAIATKEDREKLRSRLELDFDRGQAGSGPFTDFRQSELVRQFEQGGEADQWELVGVKGWNYEAGAYQVRLTYRVTTPYLISEVLLTAVSNDNAEEGGRQWYLKEPGMTAPPKPTPEGERVQAMFVPARKFGEDWLAKVGDWQWDKAYLDTLPPEERSRQDKERGATFARGLAAFRAEGLARADPETYWAPPKEKDMVVERMRGLFRRDGETPDDMSIVGSMPMFWRDADQMRFGFDLAIRFQPLASLVQARLILAADARGDNLEPADWRVEALDLVSAKSLAELAAKPGRPAATKPVVIPSATP